MQCRPVCRSDRFDASAWCDAGNGRRTSALTRCGTNLVGHYTRRRFKRHYAQILQRSPRRIRGESAAGGYRLQVRIPLDLSAWRVEAIHGFGRTWTPIPARLPAVGSMDPVGWPPPLVVVDETGRLATIRKAPSPALLTSDDQGTTWSETRLPAFQGLNGLSTDGRGRLIAVGWTTSPLKAFGAYRTVMVQSDDSGKTWSVAMDEIGTGPCAPGIIGTPDGPMLVNYGCAGSDRHYFFSARRRAHVASSAVQSLRLRGLRARDRSRRQAVGCHLHRWSVAGRVDFG